ncbi:MAG: RsbRD N-terminal domain-containing protein [Desulfobaccales bacterium]
MMKLTNLLTQKKPQILGRWIKLLYDGYPPETAIFLKKEKDNFDNPIGYGLSRGLDQLYDALVQEIETEQVLAALDEVIRIRALQDCAPSKALAFIFLLKNIVREELEEDLEAENLAAGLSDLDSRIDGLSLLGFDVYTRRREKICELRINEVKNRVSGLMRKAGLSLDDPGQEGHDQRST